jgi:hypothetical protein
MKKKANISLIENGEAGKAFRIAGINRKENDLKKIYIGHDVSDSWVKENFPSTEIVQDVNSIINDDDIDLIIIQESQKEELNIVAEILSTGKNLRIV